MPTFEIGVRVHTRYSSKIIQQLDDLLDLGLVASETFIDEPEHFLFKFLIKEVATQEEAKNIVLAKLSTTLEMIRCISSKEVVKGGKP